MAGSANPFPHITFKIAHSDRARLTGGSKPGKRTLENKRSPEQHAQKLRAAVGELVGRWRRDGEQRVTLGLPQLPPGHGLVLVVEEGNAIDFLRSAFGFEIISEEENGIVLAATQDQDFRKLEETLAKFLVDQRGGAAAKLYEILDPETSDQRLARILSPSLFESWPGVTDNMALVVDISVSCAGDHQLPDFPPQAGDEDDTHYEKRKASYLQRHRAVTDAMDELQRLREIEIERFLGDYGGAILSMSQDAGQGVFHLPDCFTVRARISGKCFKDLAQNHPHVFQITEVEELEGPHGRTASDASQVGPAIVPPPEDAPSVCVIDSGMQEDHAYLRPAVISGESRCFVPGLSPTDTADYVNPHGHGTRVAGAVLYPERLPAAGTRTELPCWLHNARVLDDRCQVPPDMMPAIYMEHVVQHFSAGVTERPARLFNHSINSRVPGRQVHMSTWGAAIDKLSHEHDVLIIQSAGNITPDDVATHLRSGRGYPQYLKEPGSAIRNPAQSLNAITVGSVAHTFWQQGQRSSIAAVDHPSAFSPAGAGIWGSIKPDVVEYGGDYVVDSGPPSMASPAIAVAPELVRSTMHSPGATSRDQVGTSFAAPKVTHLAAVLARELPAEPCLLYRALIANSARWPAWAEAEMDKASVLRRIGYGIPDLGRATVNTEYRVTLVTSGVQLLPAREAHIYHVPVPEEIRSAARDHRIRIDVALSYSSMPRRTRRRIQGYLATRLDWEVSKKGESLASFQNHIFYDGDKGRRDGIAIFQWTLRDNVKLGPVQGLSRQNSTLQKDWCYVRSHEMPPDFCIAVVGHPGWDPSPETKAKYALVVSFDAVDQDIQVYQPIRLAVEAQTRVEVRERVQVPASSEVE